MMFQSLLLTAYVAAITSAIPLSEQLFGRSIDLGSKLETRQQGSAQGYGFHNHYFYSFWSDNSRGSVTYTNLQNGSYTSQWSNIGNWVGGKGWNPGGAKSITYNGTWSAINQLVSGALWVDQGSADRVLYR